MKKDKLKFFLFPLCIFLFVIGGVYFVNIMQKNNQKNSMEEAARNAFVLTDSNQNKAIFNQDGKKLTDFIFSDVSDFENGSALVKDKNGNEGIISETGKMIVPLKKYKSISKAGKLYKLSNDKEEILITATGKKVMKLKEDTIVEPYSDRYITKLSDDDSNTFLNGEGKTILKISDDEGFPKIISSSSHAYIIIFTNKQEYVINRMTWKVVDQFKTDVLWNIYNHSSDGQRIILKMEDSDQYRYVDSKVANPISAKCEEINFDRFGNLECDTDDGVYLMDYNSKKLFMTHINNSYGSTVYLSKESYAKENGESVGIYHNGKLVKTFDCARLASFSNSDIEINKYYGIIEKKNGKCWSSDEVTRYYDMDGNLAIEKAFYEGEQFDENNLALAQEAADYKYLDNYYLIDDKGNKVSGIYDSIRIVKGYVNRYYSVYSDDNLAGLLDSSGKEILPAEYAKIDLYSIWNKDYAIVEKKNGEYIVYDLNSKKEILNAGVVSNFAIGFGDGYIMVDKDNQQNYYTLSGKKVWSNDIA